MARGFDNVIDGSYMGEGREPRFPAYGPFGGIMVFAEVQRSLGLVMIMVQENGDDFRHRKG
jgi:hypothetical protein